MSTAPSNQQDAQPGSSRIPMSLIAGLVAVVVAPIALLSLQGPSKPANQASAEEIAAVSERIQPVGKVQIKLAGGALRTGEEVFKGQCAGCHAAGALGAPKFGDAGAWGPRLGQGLPGLLNSALKGKNSMPPQAGGDFSDLEIARGVVYMTNAAGGKFEEPKAPAGDAAAK